MTQPVVYVVDDDSAVLDAIETLLRSVDLAVETFNSPLAFLEYAPQIEHGCLVLDIRMPVMGGLELQQALKKLGLEIPIIFITGHGDVPMAVQAMQAGAFHFLQKPFRDQELLDHIGEALTKDQQQRQLAKDVAELKTCYALLSPREQEVLELVVAGHANKVIAAELKLSQRTVEIHRAHIMSKMEANSLADLVKKHLLLHSRLQITDSNQ